jgi:PilZ domain
MSDFNNRRIEPRRKLMAFTPVYDLHPRLLLGYLGDMTLRGALIIGTNLVTINKQTDLEINFPSDVPDVSVMRGVIPARIAWCRQDESPDYYNIGVEYTEVSPENRELLQYILERYHFRYVLSDSDFDAQ